MLSEDTLARANTATLMRLIQQLVARRGCSLLAVLQNLQDCPERSARVDDAIQLIRRELMPWLTGTAKSTDSGGGRF
jgi:hypothetical protein